MINPGVESGYRKKGEGEKMDEDLKIVICILLLIAMIVAVIVGTHVLVERFECSRLQTAMPAREFKWLGVFEGCRVKTSGGLWINADDLYLIEIDDGAE